ncbi:TPA: CopG family transcriptional regulator [Streptococcus pneumoniae]
MATQKKRVALSLADEVAKQLEEIAKEKGLSKSALVTVWIQKNQEGKR